MKYLVLALCFALAVASPSLGAAAECPSCCAIEHGPLLRAIHAKPLRRAVGAVGRGAVLAVRGVACRARCGLHRLACPRCR